MEDIIIRGDSAFLPKAMATVSLGTNIGGKGSSAVPGGSPSSPVIKNDGGFGKIAPWGTNNLFPQTVIKEASASTIIPSTLEWKVRALYGGGIEYGTYITDKDGEEVFVRAKKDPKVEAFFRRSNISRYLIEAINDFYWFYNAFPEMVLSKDRKEILSLCTQEATYSRWEIQNPKTGLIENCYINANWEEANDEKDAIRVPVIDPYYDPVNALREDKRGFKYIYPVSYPTPGKTYYQLAAWNAIRESGWLKVAAAIPEIKLAVFTNGLHDPIHIEIATWYWSWKYPGFESLPPEQKIRVMQDELDIIQEALIGSKNAGKTIVTATRNNPESGKLEEGWRIKRIESKYPDGLYNADSQEASDHMLFALGVDGTLIGKSPGKGTGAGSGSDKREAFNMYISLCQIHADIILEPLNFIAQYNSWEDYHFRFKRAFLQTKDKITPKKREVTSA